MRTALEQDGLNEAKGQWRENLYTHHLKAQVDKLIEIRFRTLLGKCEASTDPHVQRALGEYRAAVTLKKTLETGDT